jgi:antirestriction protein ArdC
MATKNKWAKKDKDYEPKDHIQEVNDKIIAMMEEAIDSKFQKKWLTCTTPPFNPMTNTEYKGINFLALLSANFNDPRFMTFNNVKAMAEETGTEMHIKKGAKGFTVFKAMQFFSRKDGDKVVSLSAEEAENYADVSTRWGYVRAGTVFNGTQIEGLEPYIVQVNKVVDHSEIELLKDALVARTGLKVTHSEVGQAYYSPVQHGIHMPNKDLFVSTEAYYTTLLHEESHATGPALKRNQTGKFGTPDYAFEELVAEIGSFMLGSKLGIQYDPSTLTQHGAYLNDWISILKNDKFAIFKASSQASKSTDYNIGHHQEHKLELEMKNEWILNKVIEAHKEPEQKKTMSMAM